MAKKVRAAGSGGFGGGGKLLRTFLLLLVVALGGFSGIRQAHALLITTEFVFIGPKSGVGTFVLKNTAPERRAFRMAWAEVKMDPNGRRVTLDGVEQAKAVPGLMPASPYVYMAPRRMMVGPGQIQNIRFMARRTRNMAPGEYRSYLDITPEEIPDTYTGTDVSIPSGKSDVELNLKMLTGIRVPVFVLVGDTTLTVSLTNVRAARDEKGNLDVSYTLNREGNRSALGTIDVRCQKADGKTKIVGRTSVKVYTELASRDFSYIVRPDAATECVSPLTLNFTPHRDDPAYTGDPMASVTIPQ